MHRSVLFLTLACGLLGLAAQPATAANVKITPLGSHDGEFCARDRAMVFEDPDGTRILYDAGQTVMGANDPLSGNVAMMSEMKAMRIVQALLLPLG